MLPSLAIPPSSPTVIEQFSNLHTPPPRIRTIAWSPNGSFIATGSADRTLRIWNPEKPQVKNSTDLKGHEGGIERVAWNPTKDAELASVSSDGTCRFWDVRNKACTAVVQLGGEGLTIAWAADGSVVMVGRKVINHSTQRTLQGPSSQQYTKILQLTCLKYRTRL